VSNVAINGIAFEYDGWLQPNVEDPLGDGFEGYIGMQKGIFTRGPVSGTGATAGQAPGPWSYSTQLAAATVENCTAVSFQACTFEHLGGAAISLFYNTSDSTIIQCMISDVGGTGVVVNGDEDAISTNADPSTSGGYGDLISYNTIEAIGVDYADSTGIQAGSCLQLSIENNSLSDMPSDAISDGRVHTGYPSTCYISGNTINHTNRLMADGAGIYLDSSNWDPDFDGGFGTIVQDNSIFHLGPFDTAENGGPPIYGVYLDQGCVGATVRDNIIRYFTGDQPVFPNSHLLHPTIIGLRTSGLANGKNIASYDN
jgi:hypothetical protein